MVSITLELYHSQSLKLIHPCLLDQTQIKKKLIKLTLLSITVTDGKGSQAMWLPGLKEDSLRTYFPLALLVKRLELKKA